MTGIAAVFDMDGVLADNNDWHIRSWIAFAWKYGRQISPQDVVSHFGNTNKDYLGFLFGRPVSESEAVRLGEEKEAMYREMYREQLEPLPGLLNLLEELRKHVIPIALGTSAPASNVDFILDGLGIRPYFSCLVDASQIKKGKPDPEIYLKVAEKLGMPAKLCVVFEDSAHGIDSALAAGMKTVGVLSSHSPEALQRAHYLVRDFTSIIVEDLYRIVQTETNAG